MQGNPPSRSYHSAQIRPASKKLTSPQTLLNRQPLIMTGCSLPDYAQCRTIVWVPATCQDKSGERALRQLGAPAVLGDGGPRSQDGHPSSDILQEHMTPAPHTTDLEHKLKVLVCEWRWISFPAAVVRWKPVLLPSSNVEQAAFVMGLPNRRGVAPALLLRPPFHQLPALWWLAVLHPRWSADGL